MLVFNSNAGGGVVKTNSKVQGVMCRVLESIVDTLVTWRCKTIWKLQNVRVLRNVFTIELPAGNWSPWPEAPKRAIFFLSVCICIVGHFLLGQNNQEVRRGFPERAETGRILQHFWMRNLVWRADFALFLGCAVRDRRSSANFFFRKQCTKRCTKRCLKRSPKRETAPKLWPIFLFNNSKLLCLMLTQECYRVCRDQLLENRSTPETQIGNLLFMFPFLGRSLRTLALGPQAPVSDQ